MSEVFLVGGVRTPQGKYGGGLAGVRPDDLAGLVVGEAVRRGGVPVEAVDEVVLGAANQAGEDNRNVARMAVLLAGLPDTTPGYTVNRLCASGLTAIVSAAHAIRAGEADLMVAGGVFVNQTAAFSDLHGTAANPAATAALTDDWFVAGRFLTLQSRRHG
jgi:acetyl-CoA acetyltransferase